MGPITWIPITPNPSHHHVLPPLQLRPYSLDCERKGPMWRDEEARLVRHMAPRSTLEFVISLEGILIAALGPQQD